MEGIKGFNLSLWYPAPFKIGNFKEIMVMNKKQEIILWIGGLLSSAWILKCMGLLSMGRRGQLLDKLMPEGWSGVPLALEMQRQIEGDSIFVLSWLFQILVPLIILFSLLTFSLRNRK